MDFYEYQWIIARGYERGCEPVRTREQMLCLCGLGLAGEAAELLAAVAETYGNPVACRETVLLEAGDVAWYVALLCETLNRQLGLLAVDAPRANLGSLEAADRVLCAACRIADVIKKECFHGKRPDVAAWEAVGSDVQAIVGGLRSLGVQFGGVERVLDRNIAKLTERYPSHYAAPVAVAA